MQIKVTIKTEYGNERIYPACPAAEAFARLSSKKCLSRENIAVIEGLGYEVEIVTPTLSDCPQTHEDGPESTNGG